MSEEAWAWKPLVHGTDGEINQSYQRNGATVSIYAGQFLSQTQGRELINSQNVFVAEKSKAWRVVSQSKVSINLQGKHVEVDTAVIKGAGQRLQVLRWYRLGEDYTANTYHAKLSSGLAKLNFLRRDAAYITLASPLPLTDDATQSMEVLQSFVDSMLPQIESSLDRVVEGVEPVEVPHG